MATPRLRIGLVGCGHRGAALAHEAAQSGLGEVVAVHDTNPGAARQWLAKRGLRIPAVDRAALFADRSLDGVIVATPDDRHLPDAAAALRAGFPTLCEKPMAIRIADCDEMLRVRRETGVPLRIGFNLRFHPLYRKMREVAASGRLGRLAAVWVRHFVGLGGDFYFHDWHAVRERSATLLLQKATHDFDLIHFVSGSYTRRLVALGGRAYYGGERPNDLACPTCPDAPACPEANPDPGNLRNACAFRKEIDVEDTESVLMELENGVQATYAQCHFTPDYHRSYVFIGTKGRMESFEPMGRTPGWQDECRLEVLLRTGGERETFRFELGQGHGGADILMMTDWLESLRDGKPDPENPIAARQSVAAGCLAAESLRGGNPWMSVPPLP